MTSPPEADASEFDFSHLAEPPLYMFYIPPGGQWVVWQCLRCKTQDGSREASDSVAALSTHLREVHATGLPEDAWVERATSGLPDSEFAHLAEVLRADQMNEVFLAQRYLR